MLKVGGVCAGCERCAGSIDYLEVERPGRRSTRKPMLKLSCICDREGRPVEHAPRRPCRDICEERDHGSPYVESVDDVRCGVCEHQQKTEGGVLRAGTGDEAVVQEGNNDHGHADPQEYPLPDGQLDDAARQRRPTRQRQTGCTKRSIGLCLALRHSSRNSDGTLLPRHSTQVQEPDGIERGIEISCHCALRRVAAVWPR